MGAAGATGGAYRAENSKAAPWSRWYFSHWAPRRGNHVRDSAGRLIISSGISFWPEPFVVGAGLVVFAMVLENLQSLLPDRSSYFVAALYSAAGVTLVSELFIRARRRSN